MNDSVENLNMTKWSSVASKGSVVLLIGHAVSPLSYIRNKTRFKCPREISQQMGRKN